MKRFFLFAYDQYYPLGGIEDMRASAETLEAVMEDYHRYKETHRFDHCYVYYLNDDGDFEIVDREETDL